MMSMCILFGSQGYVEPIKLESKGYFEPKEALIYRPSTDTSGMYMMIISSMHGTRMACAFTIVNDSLWYLPWPNNIEKVKKSSIYCYNGPARNRAVKMQRWMELQYNTMRNIYLKHIHAFKADGQLPKGRILVMDTPSGVYKKEALGIMFPKDYVLKALVEKVGIIE